MLANELKDSLIRKIDSAYIVFGEDSYLREKALGELTALAGEDMTEFNLTVIDGQGLSYAKISEVFSQVPFMSDRRVTVVKDWNISLTDSEIKKFKSEVLESTDSVLVAVYITQTPPTALKKLCTIVDCSRLDKEGVADYVAGECRKANFRISTPALTKLVNYTSCDLARVNGELNKLFAYCKEEGEISEISVDKVVSKDIEFVVFALSNAVARKDKREAFSILDTARGDSGKNLGMLTTLTTQFRRMLHVLLNKNTDKKEVASALGISEYAVTKTMSLASGFKPVKLKAIVDRLVELEYEFKSGKILTADEALFIGVAFALEA